LQAATPDAGAADAAAGESAPGAAAGGGEGVLGEVEGAADDALNAAEDLGEFL